MVINRVHHSASPTTNRITAGGGASWRLELVINHVMGPGG